MLTLSFTRNFAPEKLSQKRWTEKQKHSQENYPAHLLPGSNFQAKKHPPQKDLCAKIQHLNIVHGGNHVSAVSAVPNAESNKDLVVDNLKPNF